MPSSLRMERLCEVYMINNTRSRANVTYMQDSSMDLHTYGSQTYKLFQITKKYAHVQ